MEKDIFKRVLQSERSIIVEELKQDWPKHFLLHQYIKLMNENSNKTCESQFLYRCGETENEVYLIETKFSLGLDTISLFFIYTNSTDLYFLTKALMETRRVPWASKRFVFEVILDKFTPAVGKAMVSKGLKAIVQHYSLFWLPPETPVHPLEPPGDVFINKLEDKHVSEVANNWPGFPGHENLIEGEILTNPGFGIFRKSDGKMLSSILSFHSGGVFMLYSLPEVRRKGYGEILLRHIVRYLRNNKIIPFCTVFSDNIASQKLVKKVGFTNIGGADYVFPYDLLQGS